MKTKLCVISVFLATRLFAGLGDLDGNGAITLDDCKLLAAKIASGESVAPVIGDIDGSGAVTIVDAMRLHQSIGGLWVEPTGKIAPVPHLSEQERAYFAQYEDVCDKYEVMSPASFLDAFKPAPSYASTLDPQKCTYYSVIDTAFKLTDAQKATLKEQGMVVLNRASTVGSGILGHYAEIYKKDLPVFFTSDALLDPLYRLYDDVLKEIESKYIIASLTAVLNGAATQLGHYQQQFASNAQWAGSLSDVSTFLAVAKALLSGSSTVSGSPKADSILTLVKGEKLANVPDLYGSAVVVDFSQFKPRGHYECEAGGLANCELSRYFKCMMWLGRADCAFVIDSLRQLRDFALVGACVEKAGALEALTKINGIISFFVGDVDGFSLEGLSEILKAGPIPIDSIMASDATVKRLQAAIAKGGAGNQLILSQAMWKAPDARRPELPKIGQVCGQRFILDSYLLGRTVEWYVKERNKPLLEEVPFSLGNNAACAVIAPDVNKYTASTGDYKPYHCRLGACRVLFDKYPYWDRNCYTLWLDALRDLSRPLPATAPAVMNSGCWQDKQMNTQLASWAQLRHNTLLYAKQSYTGGVSCFYPDGYVEPYPEFYLKIGEIAKRIGAFSQQLNVSLSYIFDVKTWTMVTDSLAAMARLELQGKPLTQAHIAFLNQMIVTNPDRICGAPPYVGWYTQLMSLMNSDWGTVKDSRPCIADVHTIPPSIISPSDMVLHAATGDASFIVLQASSAGGDCGTLYAGAVSSFYQRDESPVKRLADSDWKTMLSATQKPGAPAWFGKYIK